MIKIVLLYIAVLFSTCLAVLQSPLDTPSNEYQVFQSTLSAHYSIRIKEQNDTICDARSRQFTGWLDVGHKHLFYWYFESQDDPKHDPLVLWLTGGPGASSMWSMFQELGPCLVNSHGNGTVHNRYGWSRKSSLLFVDQPAGVGFSYLDEGEHVPDDSFTSATDMHIFLQIFLSQIFPEKQHVPFYVSGSSYAGHYIPALGAQIVQQNALYPDQPQIPLKSIVIGNGLVSLLDTAFGYWETLCTTNPGVDKPVFNETRCDIMAANLPRCVDVAKVCYNHPDPAICHVASTIFWEGVTKWYDGESGKGGRNRFDITAPCELDIFCYPQTRVVGEYLNTPKIWEALNVPNAIQNYSIISYAVAYAFQMTNDLEISMQSQIQFLLASEIDVLMYQGNLDLACNTAGSLRWANSMPWIGQAEFASKSLKSWSSSRDGKKVTAGTFKQVSKRMKEDSKKMTTFAFVTIDNAGHLVPQDQPEIALDMMIRWISGTSFSSTNLET